MKYSNMLIILLVIQVVSIILFVTNHSGSNIYTCAVYTQGLSIGMIIGITLMKNGLIK